MSKTVKIIVGIVVVVIIVFLVLNKKEGNADVIKIGYVGPFTGPVAGTAGEDIANGWKLAVLDKGTIAGKKVEVIYEDDACDPKKATSAIQKLISVDKVKIVINGVCSGSIVAMGPVAEQAKVILFTPVSTSPKITELGDYVFRTSGSAIHTAKAMISFLKDKNYKKIAVMFENQEYTVGIKDSLLKEGLVPILIEGFNSNETDLRTHLLKLSQAKPEALVLITNSTVTGLAFVKQMKDLKISLPTIANEYFAFSNVIENPDAEGIYASQYNYDPNSQKFTDYIEKYRDTYGKMPSQNIYAAMPYDGYNVLFKALEICKGDDPECVKQALYGIKNYEGITGNITIDANGDTEREFSIKQIKGGKLVDVQ